MKHLFAVLICNLCPVFSASSKGFYTSVVTSVMESGVPRGMVLLPTPGTQGSIKHGKLHILWKGSTWWILLGRCVSSLAVCSIHCGFTSSEHLEILLLPIHILNSFSRPCSNVCITYIWKHSHIYTRTSIYRKQIWFHEKKASHMHVCFSSLLM